MRILAIETSCDETAVCVIDAQGNMGADFSYSVLGNALLSQAAAHAPFGGVFPNLARREHEKNLVPIMTTALTEANLLKTGTCQGDTLTLIDDILSREAELLTQLREFLATYTKPDIDAIAVTHGPGLEPALWVGVNFARALAAAWKLPIVPVNHMEGHIVVSMTEDEHLNTVRFPLLSLLISGGHTELVLSNEWMHYQLIGQTRDDAVGEAFDKVARLMDLPYPGGPEIDRLAKAARAKKLPLSITLPRPMIDSDDYDFSFSGLKTAVRRIVEANTPLTESVKMEIAREFEDACADVLVAKTLKAVDEHGVQTVVVGGGVSANEEIRSRLAQALTDYGSDAKLSIPPRNLATDNALMIALAGYFRALKKPPAGGFVEPNSIRANGNLKLIQKAKPP
jgi:N6-L-threonylcarbamoyladenine synthase